MTSYHVSVLYNISVGIGCPNNGAQFNKCGLQGCAKYAIIIAAAILTWYTEVLLAM